MASGKKCKKTKPINWNVPLNLFLYGGSNEGKTTTLKKLYEVLTNTVFTKRNAVFPPFMYNGKWIYICTAGDGPDNILRNIKKLDKEYQKQKIDVFITAVNNDERKNPNSVDVAQDFCTGLYSEVTRSSKYALWIRKINPHDVEKQYDPTNDVVLQRTSKLDADRLKSIIDNFLSML